MGEKGKLTSRLRRGAGFRGTIRFAEINWENNSSPYPEYKVGEDTLGNFDVYPRILRIIRFCCIRSGECVHQCIKGCPACCSGASLLESEHHERAAFYTWWERVWTALLIMDLYYFEARVELFKKSTLLHCCRVI
jgi:hypothetical protein